MPREPRLDQPALEEGTELARALREALERGEAKGLPRISLAAAILATAIGGQFVVVRKAGPYVELACSKELTADEFEVIGAAIAAVRPGNATEPELLEGC